MLSTLLSIFMALVLLLGIISILGTLVATLWPVFLIAGGLFMAYWLLGNYWWKDTKPSKR